MVLERVSTFVFVVFGYRKSSTNRFTFVTPLLWHYLYPFLCELFTLFLESPTLSFVKSLLWNFSTLSCVLLLFYERTPTLYAKTFFSLLTLTTHNSLIKHSFWCFYLPLLPSFEHQSLFYCFVRGRGFRVGLDLFCLSNFCPNLMTVKKLNH